ncbi:MAG TPA: 1-acyl-sn-glycerol-3-phosphate acyltransferase [Verrucomicrobiae bacterium]|jgi:1-acyl-sn-glycerol-3-phosphate acyltransferase
MKPDFYTRLHLWLVAHRRLALGITLLIAVAAVMISSRVDLEEDILATLPQHDRLVDEYRYTIRKFRQIDRVYIDVGVNAGNPDQLAAAADEVYANLATNAATARIMYRFDMGGQQKVISFLTGALPDLFTAGDVKLLAAKLDPDAVRQYLTVMRRKLSGPEGMVLKDVVAADPVGMTGLMVAKVLPLQTGFGDGQIVDGRITSGNGRHVLLMLEPKFTSADSRDSVALVAEMLRLRDAVEKEFPGVHVAITGGHRMSVDNSTLIKTDATRCIFLGVAAMLVLCVTAYRRKWMATITFLPSIFGTLIAGAVLMLWDNHLSAIATGFATIAIGITVDYGIYVVYHLDNAATDRKSVGQIVGRLLPPMVISALTIIAAFIVLATSPMHGYQQLGIFGAVGVLVSAAFALLILPLLVPLPKTKNLPPLRFTQWMENFHAWTKRWRPLLLVGVAALTVVTAFGLKRLRFEGDIARLNGITESTRRDEELIRHTWGDALGMTLVVARGKTADEALAQNDRAAGFLAQQTNVTDVFSLAAVCPSLATQAANVRRWQNFWTPSRKETLHQTLQSVGGELGFRPDVFGQFWKCVEERPAPLTPDLFRGTPLEQALSERVAQGANDTAVSTLLKLKDRSQAGQLRDALPGMIVLDSKNFADHIAALAKSGMGYFVLWTVLAVAAIVYFALASIELVFATLLPLGFGLFWTLGLMGLLGLPIDMMNCVFVIFVIGIGEDYSVFLATSKLDEWRGHPQRICATSASVMISALTTIFGFAVLVFAKHPVLFSMGTTVLLGMACAFAATLVITPLCMDLLLFKNPPRGAPRWWHPLGTLWVLIHLGGSQVFLYGILRPVLKIISPRTADDTLRRATRWFARGVVKWMPFGKLEFQNIRAETFSPPCIVISNHQSAVDVMLIVSLPGDVRQTAKKRVFDAPMLGIGCKLLGHIQVEPNDPAITFQRCREKLSAGACVHFYPEGTRSHDGYVQRFHRGAFELAVELKQDILPVVLCDTNTAMPRDAYWFEPFHATVTALPRVTPQNFDYSLGSTALMRHCEAIVRAGLQMQLDAVNTPRVVRRKVNRLYRYQGKFVEQFVHWKMKMDPMFAVLDGVVPRAAHILDLGCGYGIATHWLASFTDTRTFFGVDYDGDKIRVAQRTAPENPRIKFETQNLLNWEYPMCDTVLLLDVLHYWQPEKQRFILEKARRALRPGGRLILRDGVRADSAGHRRVHRWEKFATRCGLNRTQEGLHFLTLAEMEAALKTAGFASWEIKRGAGRDSNVLLVATV